MTVVGLHVNDADNIFSFGPSMAGWGREGYLVVRRQQATLNNVRHDAFFYVLLASVGEAGE